jgi:hypothetical protein
LVACNQVGCVQLPLKRDVPKSLPGLRAAGMPSAGMSFSGRQFFLVAHLRLEFEGD